MARLFPHVVDNSMRKELVKCQTAARYKYEEGLRADAGSNVDTHAGKAYAAGMEAMRLAFYGGTLDAQEALNAGIRAIYEHWGSFAIPAGSKTNKTVERMAGALAHYANQYPLATDTLKPLLLPTGKWAIEVSFAEELPVQHPITNKPLVYVGRADMLAVDTDSGVWVVDEKTTSQMGDKWANQWFLDSQMTGYTWLAKLFLARLGITLEVKGAVINGMAIRLRDYEAARFNAYRPEWMINRWYEQMLMDFREWRIAFLAESHNMALDHACAMYNNPCEFSPLCASANPERIIQTSFSVKRWNPVTREEENE